MAVLGSNCLPFMKVSNYIQALCWHGNRFADFKGIDHELAKSTSGSERQKNREADVVRKDLNAFFLFSKTLSFIPLL